MLPPVMAFSGPVLRFSGTTVIERQQFPGFSGPDATIALWVRGVPIGAPPASAIILNYGEEAGSVGTTKRLMLQDMTSLRVFWSSGSINTGLKLDDQAWHHLALVLRFLPANYEATIYLDGRRSMRASISNPLGTQLSSQRKLVLGRRSATSPEGVFIGHMSSLGVWAQALEDNDIRSMAALEGPHPDAEAFMRLDRNDPTVSNLTPASFEFNDVAFTEEFRRIVKGQVVYFPLSGDARGFRSDRRAAPPATGFIFSVTDFPPVPSGPRVAMEVIGQKRLDLRLSDSVEASSVTGTDAPDGFTYSLWVFLGSKLAFSNRDILAPTLLLHDSRLVFTLRFRKDGREIDKTVSQTIGTDPFPLDKWVHIVATYNHSINLAVVYLDGKVLSIDVPNLERPDEFMPQILNQYHVGSPENQFNGLISRFGVYDKPIGALGAGLIREEISPPISPSPTSALVKRQLKNERRYDQNTFLMAHNAHLNNADGWFLASQSVTVTDQLILLGVRAFELDVFPFDNGDGRVDLFLCHGRCNQTSSEHSRGLRRFSQTLEEIGNFLMENTQEVVTVFVEWGEDRQDTEGNNLVKEALKTKVGPANKQVEIKDLVFWPDRDPFAPANSPHARRGGSPGRVNAHPGIFNWPTIGQMVEANQRLVFFVNKDLGVDGMTPHVLPFVWQYVRETLFPGERSFHEGVFTFIPERVAERDQSKGRQANRTLLRLNHFPSLGVFVSANQNRKAKLQRVCQNCLTALDLIPNFIALDFVEYGDGFEMVDQLNTLCWTQPDPKLALRNLGLTPKQRAEEKLLTKDEL